MNIYGAAMSESKREANSKVVRMVLNQNAGQKSLIGPFWTCGR